MEMEAKRAAIKYSMNNVLLIDPSKFGKVCAAGMNDFNGVITGS
jgi:DeoR/GlpR family transcriptional regulator of sugar metabolism